MRCPDAANSPQSDTRDAGKNDGLCSSPKTSSDESMPIPVRPSPFAVVADLDGLPVITHSKSQACWRLDRPALLVWRGITRRTSISGIHASLMHELALTMPEAERALDNVIEVLRANELIVDNA